MVVQFSAQTVAIVVIYLVLNSNFNFSQNRDFISFYDCDQPSAQCGLKSALCTEHCTLKELLWTNKAK